MAPEPDDREDAETSPVNTGLGVGLGAAMGVVVFALTDDPIWIGVGVALGAVAGAVRR